MLVGRPPDELVSGTRFATNALDLAWANADGIVRERRTLVYPASGWTLMMGWQIVPRLVEAVCWWCGGRTNRRVANDLW